jgi:hypothetical protein
MHPLEHVLLHVRGRDAMRRVNLIVFYKVSISPTSQSFNIARMAFVRTDKKAS